MFTIGLPLFRSETFPRPGNTNPSMKFTPILKPSTIPTLLLTVSVCLIGLHQANAQQDEQLIVFDNVFSTTNNFYGTDGEFGEEIQLSGTAREFEKFELEYFGQIATFQGDEKAVLRFYANDGAPQTVTTPTGVEFEIIPPKTVLFESPEIRLRNGRNVLTLIAGNVGELSELILPDRFTWTVEFRGLSEEDTVGLMLSGEAVNIGRSFNDFWMWNPDTEEFETRIFEDGTSAKFTQRVFASGGLPGTENAEPVQVRPFQFELTGFDPATNTWRLLVDGTKNTNMAIEYSLDLYEWKLLFTYRLSGTEEVLALPINLNSDTVFFRATPDDPKLQSLKVDRSAIQSGLVTLNISGDPKLKVRIEWTQDLTNWRPLANFTLRTSGEETFEHFLPDDVETAFYRAVILR